MYTEAFHISTRQPALAKSGYGFTCVLIKDPQDLRQGLAHVGTASYYYTTGIMTPRVPLLKLSIEQAGDLLVTKSH